MAQAKSLNTKTRRNIQRRSVRAKKLPIGPIILLIPVIVCGIFGQFFYPHNPDGMNLSISLRPPAWLPGGEWTTILGTDHLGRDLLTRLIAGARASLIVAVVGVALAGFIGISLGVIAGYFEGTIDNIIMRFVDSVMSIPAILLAILIAAALGSGLTTIIISIAIVFWTHYARVIRGETLRIKQLDFVNLARITGCGHFRIIRMHILPNLVATSMVVATLQLGRAIIVEAALTFLGLGLQPPAAAWGLIIAEGRGYITTAWWIPTFAGFAIMMTVLGANMFGDWLRDALDPKLRQI